MQKQQFERSAELKRVFNQLSDQWCRKHRLGLPDLAERCGVSMQYLSHVGRYGRIPSKPILTLLALNLEVANPQEFFQMANMNESWPYESGIALRPRSATDSGLLSINLDMNGFADVIREIVRAEVQPKRLDELLGGRPLKVGLNRAQFFLFEEHGTRKNEGFFPELVRSLALALHCAVEFVDVSHATFAEELERGTIDCFGPVYRTAPRIADGLFGRPFCSVAVVGIGRVRKAQGLTALPAPKKISDLRKKDYIIAVHRESMAHHFVSTELGIPAERIIPCELPDEAVERVMLASLPRPAHLLLTDSPHAHQVSRAHPTTTELLFTEAVTDTPPFEDTFVVRADWPALLTVLDQAVDFMRRGGALNRLFERTVGSQNIPGIEIS